jgi:mannose-1-phosphate guanylyltransferase/mannose-6-phosphate isomerase
MITPVIMSGGSGTRLWPLSRALYPKQFLKLAGSGTMLQEAAKRVADPARFAAPVIICAEEHRFIIAEQLREAGITPQAILLEPAPRSTAAVAALACHYLLKQGEGDPLFLLMPTDHAIGNVPSFITAVDAAAGAARKGFLTTFGITPETPETGYGYIKPGAKEGDVQRIAAFVEKPDAARAKEFVAQGYMWNSGMFLFGARRAAEELARLQPDVMRQTGLALEKAVRDLDFIRLDKESFEAAPSVSVDVGLMEKTAHAAVVQARMGWSDVGTFDALWKITEKDASGNAVRGEVALKETRNSYVHSTGPLTVTLGVEDLIIVAERDVVMVADKSRAQDVKDIVADLKKKDRAEVQHGVRVTRPWGWYESLGDGQRFQVKRLCVMPGRAISLQKHQHRSEHWVVVEGAARVTRNAEEVFVHENESIYLPAGTVHRLANAGKIPLVVVEVQTGSYLGEDDIIRIEDQYGRK